MEGVRALLDHHHHGGDVAVLGALISTLDLELLQRVGRRQVGLAADNFVPVRLWELPAVLGAYLREIRGRNFQRRGRRPITLAIGAMARGAVRLVHLFAR